MLSEWAEPRAFTTHGWSVLVKLRGIREVYVSLKMSGSIMCSADLDQSKPSQHSQKLKLSSKVNHSLSLAQANNRTRQNSMESELAKSQEYTQTGRKPERRF